MKERLTIIIIFIFTSLSLSAQQSLSIGDKVPLFKATADDGSTWDISKFIGSNYIVIYFYPGALTAGCTTQACAYRDHQEDLASANAIVVGISGDKIDNLKLFRKAEDLNFPLLSDETGTIAKSFGVPVGDGASMKRTVEGTEYNIVRDITIKRWTFIVGKDGKIIYKNEAVNPAEDTEQILGFLRTQE